MKIGYLESGEPNQQQLHLLSEWAPSTCNSMGIVRFSSGFNDNSGDLLERYAGPQAMAS
jgi:hypothetical protein